MMKVSVGSTPTAYHFTGQREDPGLGGLMFYRARYYDNTLGRFTQADTMIPGAGNPLAWDRYAYSLNSPLVYNDPTGHWINPQNGQSAAQTDEYGTGNYWLFPTLSFTEAYQEYITHVPNVVLACGMETGKSCANGEPVAGYSDGGGDMVPLQPYKDWASENGYTYSYFDYDTYGTKWDYANAITKHIQQSSSNQVVMVGHSAGADASILSASSNLLGAKEILGIVLLDPTLNATFPVLGKTNISSMANQLSNNFKVALGDTDEPGVGYVNIDGAKYYRDETNMSHKTLAVSKIMMKWATNSIFGR